MTTDPDSNVVAYCAPGLKGYAAALIAGETYRELVEHPWMAGRTDVILAADPVFPLPAAGPGANPRTLTAPAASLDGMATGDVTLHVDLDDVLTVLRAILATAQLTDGKVSLIMTEVGNAQAQVTALAAQIEGISARQDAAAQILKTFVETHQGNDAVDLTPILTALGHLEGTTGEVEGVAGETQPAAPPAGP